MKEPLRVAFSGGRTSAYMSKMLLDNCSDKYDLIFTFANTGFEHPDTLRFANDVDKHFGLNLVWLEAVVFHGERKSCGHRVVSYKTASRNGEPFEAVVSKYGLPNQTFKLCTRELKANTMDSYMRSIGLGDAPVAIGIRADERRRVSKGATQNKIIYPLVDMFPTCKEDVLAYFEQFDWDLRIKEHQGNCITCFQKSDKKLNTLYRENPSNFDFFVKLETLYSGVGPNNVPGPRKFFRGYRSTADLLRQFEFLNADSSKMFSDRDSGTCTESCELYETELLAG